jgi:hypothetical protein
MAIGTKTEFFGADAVLQVAAFIPTLEETTLDQIGPNYGTKFVGIAF